MKIYKCDRCDKIFKQKSHFISHQNRVNPCTQTVRNVSAKTAEKKAQHDTTKMGCCPQKQPQNKKGINDTNTGCCDKYIDTKSIICSYCNREFKKKFNLNVHLEKRCPVKKQLNREKEEIYRKLLEKMELLEKSNQEIKKENKKLRCTIIKMKNNTINIHNNISYTNNNNNIKLVAYGKEDKKKIDQQEIINAIQGFGTEVALTKLIHFNDKYPENHNVKKIFRINIFLRFQNSLREFSNVYINSMKDKYAMTFDGEKWILKPKIDIVDDIYDTNRDLVEEKMDDFIRSLDESRLNALRRWLNTYEDDAKILKIKEEIKLLLYNEKEKIIKSNCLQLIE